MTNKDIILKIYPLESNLNDKMMKDFPDNIIQLINESTYRYYLRVHVTNVSNGYLYISHLNKTKERYTRYFTVDEGEVTGISNHQQVKRHNFPAQIDILAPNESSEYLILISGLTNKINRIKTSIAYVKTKREDLEKAKIFTHGIHYALENYGEVEIDLKKQKSNRFCPTVHSQKTTNLE